MEYWLQSILARAKGFLFSIFSPRVSPQYFSARFGDLVLIFFVGCKILLVGTHLDEVTPEKASRIVKQMSEKYLQKIPVRFSFFLI